MKIKVSHSKGFYNVWLFNNHLKNFLHKERWMKNRDVFMIIDSNVYKYHIKNIKDSFTDLCNVVGTYRLNATEKNKTLFKINDIYSALVKSGCNRQIVIISIGGGITGDIASFAASTYMRGVKYVNVPTTLLSMVDSSIGGKTGVNFFGYKNFIGTFYQPSAVFIDTSFLNTLPFSEFYSGLGEVLKYALLVNHNPNVMIDKKLFSPNKENLAGFESLISECIRFKAAVVEADEEEQSGIRKILNLGHTFAHAIEASTAFKIKHGQAVLFGLVASLFYSYNAKLISAELLYNYLLRLKPYIPIVKVKLSSINTAKISAQMIMDKKTKKGRVNLVLLARGGKILVDYIAKKNLITKSIDEMLVWMKESFKKETVEK